jgi:hypothetical protein
VLEVGGRHGRIELRALLETALFEHEDLAADLVHSAEGVDRYRMTERLVQQAIDRRHLVHSHHPIREMTMGASLVRCNHGFTRIAHPRPSRASAARTRRTVVSAVRLTARIAS